MGLITTDFSIKANVCFEITLACAPVSTLYVIIQSFIWRESFQSEFSFLSVTFI